MSEELLQIPGQVIINEIVLISGKGVALGITDYLVELNLYESIFNPVVTGSILLSDSTNLISLFPLIGEEFLKIDIKTPSLDDSQSIYKTFRINSILNKTYAKDGSTLIYELGLTSVEAFQDSINPIFKSFEGTPGEIIQKIYTDYLQVDRNILVNTNNNQNKTPLTILEYPTNFIKFVSPGWTPIQCINWIASKSLPSNKKAANYLFWETTKGFFFGSTEKIFSRINSAFAGTYVYSETYINTLGIDEKSLGMYAIRSLKIDQTMDQLDNTRMGYLASTLYDIDLYNKNYNMVKYDHALEFSNYSHLNGDTPMFDKTTLRNPLSYIEFNYSSPKLHNSAENNFDQMPKFMFGNRRSNMLELNNFKMEITIPGRTDLEVGNIVGITFPKSPGAPLTKESKSDSKRDELYSGNYLVTNLAHKINPKTHYITMNVLKDSFNTKSYNKAGK